MNTRNISVEVLEHIFNKDRPTGITHISEEKAPTYFGVPINFVFSRKHEVTYVDIFGGIVAKFCEMAILDC